VKIGSGKNILAVHNKYMTPGGEDKSHVIEKEMLQHLGFEVFEYLQDNRKVSKIGKTRTAFRSIWSTKTYKDVTKIIEENDIDIVVIQNFFPLISPSIYYAAKKFDVHVIQYLRNFRLLCPSADFYRNGDVCEECLGKTFQYPAIKYGCYKNSRLGSSSISIMNYVHKVAGTWENKVSLYLALTEFGMEKFIEGGLPKDKILTKPNFLHPDPGVGTHHKNQAVCIGRLSEEKGIRTLINAWNKLEEPINLVILGNGPLESLILKAQEKDKRIIYKGNVSTKEVYNTLKESLFMVFTSECYEGMPRTLIEAFATGTPVISSDIGSMSSMIEHATNGLHFQPGNVVDLVNTIHKLLQDEQLRKRLSVNSRNDYLKKYTREANKLYYEQIFKKLQII
jgi:glycosyltransferase involved in cell wall biosynthesis